MPAPQPFDKMGGARLQSSGLVDVSSDLTAVFLVRDGDTLDRRAFFGHLMQRTSAGLVPITILHYHPSHKGLHLRVNCGSLQDYTERLLPGAPELALATPQGLDPASDWDRKRLVVEFCRRCGIRIAPDDDQLI
jgi:hypothetical protein